jgi:hypothetical protein
MKLEQFSLVLGARISSTSDVNLHTGSSAIFKMASSTCARAVGFIKTKDYDVFDQCCTFCLTKEIDYHSSHYLIKDKTVFYVHLFSIESSKRVITFMNKLGLKYIYINCVIQDGDTL